ncbi:MAG: rhodanese-like domain-containing protein, partial [Pseudomonadota bacterium]
AVTPSNEKFRLSRAWRITEPEILDAIYGNTDVALIDARPLEFLEGMNQHQAALEAGTIHGAANLEHSVWFQKGPTEGVLVAGYEPPRQILESALGRSAKAIATFCNVGRWSATNWFMLSEVAGLDDVRLYPEGMVGWTKAGHETVVAE